IPLGGFVKFAGESQLAGDVGKVEDGLAGRPYPDLSVGQRSIVSLAGPLANFALASVLFALLIGVFGRPNVEVGVMDVTPGGPAARAGLQAGDVFLTANGKAIKSPGDLQVEVILNPGTPVTLNVRRDGAEKQIVVTPEQVVRANDV